MVKLTKVLRSSIVATSLLIGSTSLSWAQASGSGVGPFGGELRGIMQFTGKVVCVSCTINEVRHAHPQLPNLYLLKLVGNEQQKAVVSVETISEPQRWDAVVFPHEVLVRSTDDLFHKLTAEENLYKTVSVTGLLRNDRIMDVENVTFPE
jgi:hypothetical protein